MRDALYVIFDVPDPSRTVTLESPAWVPGWHAPLLKYTKSVIYANRNDTYDLHRLVVLLMTCCMKQERSK